MAAGVAHEINNPLASILQNTEVIERRLSQSLESSQKIAEEVGLDLNKLESFLDKRNILDMIENIKEASNRASKIIKNMLTFSRREILDLKQTDIKDLMDKAVELSSTDYNLKKGFDFKKIKIKKEYDPDTPMILCERTKILQVFLNLLNNGAQAMFKDSTKKKKPQFQISIKFRDEIIIIEISDNGPGVPEKDSKQIFDPFYTTKEEGTGLGLSVAYFIITEQHGGTMELDSPKEGGAKFTITLPIHPG
jgi:signal transduction histidine kinase